MWEPIKLFALIVAVRVVLFTTLVGWETPSQSRTVLETKLVPFAVSRNPVPAVALVGEIETSAGSGGLHFGVPQAQHANINVRTVTNAA